MRNAAQRVGGQQTIAERDAIRHNRIYQYGLAIHTTDGTPRRAQSRARARDAQRQRVAK